MTLSVRRVGPEAADEVLGVVRAAFAHRPPLDPPADALGETEASVAAVLAGDGGLVATLDGRAVGALVLDRVDEVLFVRRFGVRPDARGHGIARALVVAACSACPELDEVAVLARLELPSTIGFWRSHGFTEVGRRPPYVELRRRLATWYDVGDADRMRDLGRTLSERLRAGDLVVLSGGLGAGKTTLTQGLGAGLGVRGAVTSPTFVIARTHPPLGDGPALVHVDAYRLGGLAELDDLDLDASLEEAVTVVEWGGGLAETLTDSWLEVRIDRAVGGEPSPETESDPRRVRVRGVGTRWLA